MTQNAVEVDLSLNPTLLLMSEFFSCTGSKV